MTVDTCYGMPVDFRLDLNINRSSPKSGNNDLASFVLIAVYKRISYAVSEKTVFVFSEPPAMP